MEFVEVNRNFFGRLWSQIRCSVHPRYSAGSGSSVPDHIALQVAREEKDDYQRALEGVYGEEQKRRAEILGLRGIAYAMAEKGTGRNFRWLIYDLCTGEYFRRHSDAEIVKMGFTPFRALSDADRAAVNKTGREADYERTYWKKEFDRTCLPTGIRWTQYEPELVRVED